MEWIGQICPVGGVGDWMRRGARRGPAQAIGLGLRAPFIRQALGLSGLLNVLQLTVSLSVLRIYDHVLPGRNLAALAVLTGAVFVLHALFALVDLARSRLLSRAGISFLQALDGRALEAIRAGVPRRGLAAVHDVERVARFLANAGPSAFFDILWVPIFLVAAFCLHPALGGFAGAGLMIVAGVAVAAESRGRNAARRISRLQYLRFAVVRDAEAAAASCGSLQRSDLVACWNAVSRSYYDLKSRSADRELKFAALGKGLRLMLQSGGLALGALLVVEGAMSAGGLVASSVIMGRMFVSLDTALAHWRSFVVARTSYARLVNERGPPAGERMV